MLKLLILVAIGLLEIGTILGGCFFWVKRNLGNPEQEIKILNDEIDKFNLLSGRVSSSHELLVPMSEIAEKIDILAELNDLVQTEQGRTVITQVELETVETRLRELEEIHRELEASEIEAKQELDVLRQREAELAEKNEILKKQIEESNQILETLYAKVEFSEEAKSTLGRIQGELTEVNEQSERLIEQIKTGNEQYFNLKRRFDALDIEYAQLYEKFMGG